MFGFCSHKWSDIKDGYQFCTKCNKAKLAPVVPCVHNWEIIEKSDIKVRNRCTGEWNVHGRSIISKCVLCGEVKHKTYNTVDGIYG